MSDRTCALPGCQREHASRGLCGMHYMRLKRFGDPLREPMTAEARFWSHVSKTGDCWLWTAGLTPNGYGKTTRSRLAHRVSYEYAVGPIPSGMHVDHLCMVKTCVRPDHLEAVPPLVNAQRRDAAYGMGGAVTECPHGHPYDALNTAHRNGRRHCRTCERLRAQRVRLRKKAS